MIASLLIAFGWWAMLASIAFLLVCAVLAFIACAWMGWDWLRDQRVVRRVESFGVAERVHAHLTAQDDLESLYRLPAARR